MEKADGLAYVYTTAAATLNFNWVITPQPNNSAASTAAVFKVFRIHRLLPQGPGVGAASHAIHRPCILRRLLTA